MGEHVNDDMICHPRTVLPVYSARVVRPLTVTLLVIALKCTHDSELTNHTEFH